ncbi:MAG TPA: stress response translation initiation inhibitor YciH [Chloroflexota bacterium]|nr:stress response translation initiation inhibitor YciH [Chloroflexota bacterium]
MTSRLVYSTDAGRVAGEPEKAPKRRKADSQGPSLPQAPDDGWLRVWRLKGGRGGKVVTVVTGVPAGDVERLAVEMRRLVGAGGGVREGALEVQGDHRERVQKKLADLGYRVKLAGG